MMTAKPKAKSKPAAKATKTAKAKSAGEGGASASQLIDQRIQELAGWRGETLARVRALILKADPGITEEWKWATPVWSHNGILCTGEAYTKVVKLTFAKGASIPDPAHLFNSSLEGNTRRAIDIPEGAKLDAAAFKALIKAAVAHNGPSEKTAKPSKSDSKSDAKPVKLLSGGNPQIAKADGDEPIQAYIAAMPGWKSALGKRIDAIITRAVPNVTKAVRWNSPFYGAGENGWIVTFHVLTKYVKVTFFAGTSLKPIPPGGTPKSKEARWLDIYEKDVFDEAQMEKWVKQAAKVPGWILKA